MIKTKGKMQRPYRLSDKKDQLKIESKKLKSGKCQVKFYLTSRGRQDLYGYTLVEAGKSLREVVHELRSRLEDIDGYEFFYQNNLFSIRRNNQSLLNNMLIFKNNVN